jgi:hypothetical protein
MNNNVEPKLAGGYIDELRASRQSPAVLKTKLMILRGQQPNCHVFAFEGDNDKAVYFQWVRRIRSDLSYEPFPCDGKKQVFQLREVLGRDLGNLGSRVYFFIDRDFDDLADHDLGEATFITDQYSAENYLVSEEVLDELLKDEFHCHGEPIVRAEIIQSFQRVYEQFLEVTKNANFRLFVARRLKFKVIGGLPDAINVLASVNLTQVSPAKKPMEQLIIFDETPDQGELVRLAAVFDNLNPREHYRGKFNYLFFMKWLNLLSEDRRKEQSIFFANVSKPRVVKFQSISLGMLASKSRLPTGLSDFIAAIQ